LALTAIWFSDDDGPRLGHLLSPSCCPRLRKLTLSHLHGLHDLRLDGGELENLYLADLDVRRLGVYTPRLLALTVEAYFMHQQNSEHTSLTIRAPGLEKLEYTLMLGGIQLELQHYTIHLMQECRPSDGHTLYLYVPEVCITYFMHFEFQIWKKTLINWQKLSPFSYACMMKIE
jgi:hypothetical protein